ncbi:MAG: hypothetical protein SNG35_05170 [Rikenellaceae bacterium]
MKIFKRSTIFKTQATYFVSVLFAFIFCIAAIPFRTEFNTRNDATLTICMMAVFILLLAVIIYFVYSSLRYIILHGEYIEFRGALPPIRARKYRYSEIKRCSIEDSGSKIYMLVMVVYTRDGKSHREYISMVKESTLREIANELMSNGVAVESKIKI